MELDFRKKSRRDRIRRSESFESQEVSEIARKEAGESKSFSILWMDIMEDIFQMKGNGMLRLGKIENVKKKIMPEQRRCFSMG